MQPTTSLKPTPFLAYHRAAGARLVDFAGFEMPLRYRGEVHEHDRVRGGAGLFDVSHMGEFRVTGTGAAAFLDRMVANDVAGLVPGQALYTPMCRPDGGIVDDLLVYRAADDFMLVVNAANIAKDLAWLAEHRPAAVAVEDVSGETALLALQGPRAAEVLAGLVPAAALDLAFARFVDGELLGVPARISRTGYTGEDGFELYFHPRGAAQVWEGLVAAGAAVGLEPVGLGARDTLRLEMGYMLYGNDIDDTTSPIEAGLGWTVKRGGDFIGRQAIERQRAAGVERRLVGLRAGGRRVPRSGMAIAAGTREVGRVTSGAHSPTLAAPIAMGYVEAEFARLDGELEVVAGAARIPARVVSRPFYTGGSRR